jgi:hypothetical protein
MSLRKKLLIVLSTLVLVVIVATAFLLNFRAFILFDKNHYLVALDGYFSPIYRIGFDTSSGQYTKEPESLLAAVWNDPNPAHWWPIDVITDAELDRRWNETETFTCPNDYSSTLAYTDGTAEFISDFQDTHPASTTDDLFTYRNQLLEQHHCEESRWSLAE